MGAMMRFKLTPEAIIAVSSLYRTILPREKAAATTVIIPAKSRKYKVLCSAVIGEDVCDYGQGTEVGVLGEFVEIDEEVDDYSHAEQDAKGDGVTDEEVFRNVFVEYFHIVFVCQ